MCVLLRNHHLRCQVAEHLDEEQLKKIVDQTFLEVKREDPEMDLRGITFEEFEKVLGHTDISTRLTINF